MKKQHLPDRTILTNFAMQTIFLIFLFVSNIFSQIIINERVEINGSTSESNSQNSSSIIYKDDIHSYFIMPKSGVLQIGYTWIGLFDLELPDYSTFNTYFFKDDSTNSDTLSNIFELWDITGRAYFDTCIQDVNFVADYSYIADPFPNIVDLGYVTEGDTVQFIYHSDMWGEEADIPLLEAVEVWDDTVFLWWECTFAYIDSCLELNPFLNTIYVFVQFMEEDELVVSIEPDEIAPGDTAEIVLKKKLPDGTQVDFDSTQTFEVGMLEGCMSGNLIVGTPPDTGSSFYNIHQPIRFAAADTLVGDSTGSVIMQVGVIDTVEESNRVRCLKGIMTDGVKEKTKTKRPTVKLECNSPSILCFNPAIWRTGEPKPDTLTIREHKILLGEMKFYGVKKKTENGNITEIRIEEIEVAQDATPVYPNLTGNWSWIQESTIWSGRPINIETHGQSPIFYDKFYAQVYYTGTTKPVIHDLPQGMIRIIGRYLGKTPENKVKLFTTQYQNFTDTLEIQVIRPDKLGDNILSVTGPTKVDYVDTTYNIDSLVITVSGQLGIPPQILMGIVEKESEDYPLYYRYEPFADMNTAQKSFDSTHRYWIESETELGDPPAPHHNNIRDLRGSLDNYPGFITVWEIYNEKNQGQNKMYGFAAYPEMKTKRWDVYNKNWVDTLKKRGVNVNLIVDSARVIADTSYIKFIRDSIGGKGMYGTIAQTRFAASYGLMQLTYYGAVDAFKDSWSLEYPNDDAQNLPEYIMIPDINIEYASKHFLGRLRNSLPGSIVYPNEDTWPKDYAFEISYWEALCDYNGCKVFEYPNSVFNHAKSNLPKKD